MGGAGADKLTGGTGDDLLIAGLTDFDKDPLSLSKIFDEWTSGSSYTDRISHSTNGGGLNGTTVLGAATVHDDGVKDTTSGGLGADWFVVSGLDITNGILPSETKTVI